jgi:RNA polymerase sigma factor (sigma-70 family)
LGTLTQNQTAKVDECYASWKENPEVGAPSLFQSLRYLSQNIVWNKLRQDNPELAEEAAEEVFLHLANYSGSARFSTFAWRIINNTVNDWFRENSQTNRETVSLESIGPNYPAKDQTQQQVLLHSAISKLKPQLQEIVSLYLQGLTFEEIGAQLSIPASTAQKRWQRALRSLRQQSY